MEKNSLIEGIKNYLKAVSQSIRERNGMQECKNCGVDPLEVAQDIEEAVKSINQEWLKRIEASVPKKLEYDKEGLVERYHNGEDMWGEEYADRVNEGIKMYNLCRQEILNNIKELKV